MLLLARYARCAATSTVHYCTSCLPEINGSTSSAVMAGRLPCGNDVVLALDGKDL